MNRLPATALLLAALFIVSCTRKEPKAARPVEVTDSAPYTKEYTTGPLKVRLSLDRTKLRLDERIAMTLEAEVPEEYTVTLPPLEAGVAQFKWDLRKSDAPRLTDAKTMLYRREMSLEPLFVQDKLAIKPLTVHFTRPSRKNPEEQREYDIETDEVPLNVTMPPEDFWRDLSVDTVASEVPVDRLSPPRRTFWFWCGGGALVVIAAAVLVLVLLKRRRKAIAAPPKPLPQAVAMDELRALAALRLVENGQFMEFYNRIQAILRRYIEAQFNIHAPERTTEEFLDELRRIPGSPVARHRQLLESFLTHCDLVRFAAMTPDKDEIQKTFNACRDFIVATS